MYVDAMLRGRESLYEDAKEKEESLKNARINALQKEIVEIRSI